MKVHLDVMRLCYKGVLEGVIPMKEMCYSCEDVP